MFLLISSKKKVKHIYTFSKNKLFISQGPLVFQIIKIAQLDIMHQPIVLFSAWHLCVYWHKDQVPSQGPLVCQIIKNSYNIFPLLIMINSTQLLHVASPLCLPGRLFPLSICTYARSLLSFPPIKLHPYHQPKLPIISSLLPSLKRSVVNQHNR